MIEFQTYEELAQFTEDDLPPLSTCEKTFIILCEFRGQIEWQKRYYETWEDMVEWYIKNEEHLDASFSVKKQGFIKC